MKNTKVLKLRFPKSGRSTTCQNIAWILELGVRPLYETKENAALWSNLVKVDKAFLFLMGTIAKLELSQTPIQLQCSVQKVSKNVYLFI